MPVPRVRFCGLSGLCRAAAIGAHFGPLIAHGPQKKLWFLWALDSLKQEQEPKRVPRHLRGIRPRRRATDRLFHDGRRRDGELVYADARLTRRVTRRVATL